MKLSEELAWRGLINQHTFDDVSAIDGSPISFYWGVDPSANSMTIGNLASAMLVKHFINHGHKAFLLVGGATGLIGDPDGKKDERNLKSRKEIELNKAAISKQYAQVFAGSSFETVDNFDWFKNINFIDFLTTVGKHVPTSDMFSRGFVQSRLETTGISYAEFSYSLIQAYDFLHLFREHDVTLQLCGSDQWGNSTAGSSLIRRVEGKTANVFTTPLVVNKTTGVKFGKSEEGAVWLDAKLTSIFKFYQFWLNVTDDSVINYLKIFTMLSHEEIDDLESRTASNPSARAAQKTLAYSVTEMVHGAARASDAVTVTRVLFSGAGVAMLSTEALEDLKNEIGETAGGINLSQILVNSSLAFSISDARRLMKSGGISVNGNKVFEDLEIAGSALVKRGKNQFILVV
jgi:tyrosyl-tRNA synthetase